jgi:hypothetical protein
MRLVDEPAVSECDGDPEYLAIRGKCLAGLLFEALEGIHELHLIVAILFVERGGIDSPPPILLNATLAGGWRTLLLGSCIPGQVCSELTPGSTFVEQRVARIGGKIEFRWWRFRLIIVITHAFFLGFAMSNDSATRIDGVFLFVQDHCLHLHDGNPDHAVLPIALSKDDMDKCHAAST